MTYSIVARDPETGELGVAVQTRSFAVGAIVPWAEAGVGAVATQAFTERSYGPLTLSLLQAGRAADEALRGLVAADPDEAVRQVGVVDAAGRTAVHTGERCVPEAGHLSGTGFTVQANMMRSAEVWPAMADAYERPAGSLPQRLLAALDAAEAAGGDFRGRQTAALLVVEGTPSGRPWDARVVDVRVDDHPDPLGELRRLVTLAEAYRRLRLLAGDLPTDEVERARAAGVAQDHVLWFAAAAAWRAGNLDEARRRLTPLILRDHRWERAWQVLAATPPPDRR